MPPLSNYLSRLRGAVFPHSSGLKRSLTAQRGPPQPNNKNITLVMGNPSADLDSFISAVVLSYFYNHSQSRIAAGAIKHVESSASAPSTLFVPILNLPAVRSEQLWRQRPEFGVALKIAIGKAVDGDELNGRGHTEGDGNAQSKGLEELEQVITIADVNNDESSLLRPFFSSTAASHGQQEQSTSPSSASPATPGHVKQNLLLVDHNSPSIPGLDDGMIRSRFNVIGCVDHHVDEDYVPKDADPRIVTTGIGSCTSLVVNHLRQEGLWPEAGSGTADEIGWEPMGEDDTTTGLLQITRLALAPILIDTSNLKATGDKCSDTDREAVRFLESIVSANASAKTTPSTSSQQPQSQTPWDRTASYDAISSAKANSLSLLTMQETFDRDYKAWTEQTTDPTTTGKANTGDPSSAVKDDEQQHRNHKVNIGITSLVKPLSWLIKHAGGIEPFVDEIETFAHDPGRELGVFAMLTRAGGGKKEVVVLATSEGVKGVVRAFERDDAAADLRLSGWEGEDDDDDGGELLRVLRERFGGAGVGVWWMGDTSKSRKQVAPLLRDVVRGL